MAESIRALVVDDEEIGRRGVRLLLDEDPEVEVVGEAATAERAVEAIRDEKPDLLFLDVQLGPRDGFSVLREIGTAGDYVRLHVGQRSHLHRETMYRLEKRLDPSVFVRIHRSAIVRLDRIASVRFEESGGHRVVLSDGTEHSLSRSGRERLEEALGQEL